MKNQYDNLKLQRVREQYIKKLALSFNATEVAKNIADDLFALDLTVYSKNYTLESLIYNSFAESLLDPNISLHPEQLRIINKIENYESLIVSAPTSFGKTFSVFEYIARKEPNNIVLIVPTLALVSEYMKKIIKKYNDFFRKYKVYTQVEVGKNYSKFAKNIFILTHDRVLQDEIYNTMPSIDLLVIDEVYKLESDTNNDRVLVLNMAYYYLSKKAKKYVLLAPFINSIEDIDKLEKHPCFFTTDYSPVVNDVITEDLINDDDRYPQCQKILNDISPDEKTLIYFPTVLGMYKYINEFLSLTVKLDYIDSETDSFIKWAREEFHPDWSIVKALERGYTVHNGQIPLGIRTFLLNLYESNNLFNRLLCTSTLLEGVNTTAKNLIITKPSRMSEKKSDFSAFDFFNLVGRTGRLNQHLIGKAYYLKGPNDPQYQKEDAVKSIKFELTDNSKDVDIQIDDIEYHDDYKEFLFELHITHEQYKKNIGSHFRFDTVKELYKNYMIYRNNLINVLMHLKKNNKDSRRDLIKCLYKICEGKEDSLNISAINNILNLSRPKIRDIVENLKAFYKKSSVDNIISIIIRMKNSYIEHRFYNMVLIIKFFLMNEKKFNNLLEVLDIKVINTIDVLYFSSSKQKRMLLDLGIYERDIDNIISIIGDNYVDIFEMKELLKNNFQKFKNIGYITKFIIRNL